MTMLNAILAAHLSKRPTALVWDDDPEFQAVVSKKLERWGFRVITEPDHKRLTARIRKEKTPIALGIVDWVDQSTGNHKAGIEAVAALARRNDACFVVVLTGESEALRERIGPGYEQSAIRAGADTVKQKGKLGLLGDKPLFREEIMGGIVRKCAEAIAGGRGGLDLRSVYAGLAAGLEATGRGVPPLAPEAHTNHHPAQEAKIADLYAQLRRLLKKTPTDATNAAYDRILGHLRVLQQEQAAVLRARFEANRPLSKEFADQVLARIKSRAN